MLTKFRVQNYKALRDVTLELTPIHVLIGPNDSGKSSIIEALGAFSRSVDVPLSHAFEGDWEGCDLVWKRDMDSTVVFAGRISDSQEPLDYTLYFRFASKGRGIVKFRETATGGFEWTGSNEGSTVHQNYGKGGVSGRIHDALSGIRSCRWIPRSLALPVVYDHNRRFILEPSGFGLALCLHDLLGFDRPRFTIVETKLREIFPSIESIAFISQPAFSPSPGPAGASVMRDREGVGLAFRMANGQEIPAPQASDGVLLVLAFLTLVNIPAAPRFVLFEEPENGIHPQRLREILALLKELVSEQDHTQVIFTTHSPYVLDQFKPEEVTVCQKGNDGAVFVQRLSESERVNQLKGIFTLGEIWSAEGEEALTKPMGGSEAGAP